MFDRKEPDIITHTIYFALIIEKNTSSLGIAKNRNWMIRLLMRSSIIPSSVIRLFMVAVYYMRQPIAV